MIKSSNLVFEIVSASALFFVSSRKKEIISRVDKKKQLTVRAVNANKGYEATIPATISYVSLKHKRQ